MQRRIGCLITKFILKPGRRKMLFQCGVCGAVFGGYPKRFPTNAANAAATLRRLRQFCRISSTLLLSLFLSILLCKIYYSAAFAANAAKFSINVLPEKVAVIALGVLKGNGPLNAAFAARVFVDKKTYFFVFLATPARNLFWCRNLAVGLSPATFS